MQHNGEASESVAVFSWAGAELLTVFQVLFFLVLGYAVSRVWILFRPRTQQAPAKKVDDINAESDERPEVGQSEASSSPVQPTIKARHSNAAERKRQRKSSAQLEVKQQDLPPIVNEVQEDHNPPQEAEALEEVPEAEEITTVETPRTTDERVAKLMMKKAARKARKATLQKDAEETAEVEVVAPVAVDKPGPFNLTPTASTPSMATTAGESCESDESPAPTEQQDCSTPASTSAVESPRGRSPKTKTKKKQRKVQEETAQESCEAPAVATPKLALVADVQEKESSVTTSEVTVEASPVPEPCATTEPDVSVDDEPLQSHIETETEQQCMQVEESIVQAEEAADNYTEPQGPLEHTMLVEESSQAKLDNLDYMTDSESDVAEQMAEADDVQNLQDISNAPVMWCGMPQSPNAQIDGWVAVAVPVECAPPGAFDGLWKNTAEERILIEKLEIMFESGVTWNMEMHSVTQMSVEIDGEQVFGELDNNGNLVWSDGDVWTFFGPAEDPSEAPKEAMPEIPCMMVPFIPEGLPIAEMSPMNQCIPVDAEKWEICWDWKKKGRCPRGMNCEWYHPMPEQHFF